MVCVYVKIMLSGDNASPGNHSHQPSPRVISIGRVKGWVESLKTITDQLRSKIICEVLLENHKYFKQADVFFVEYFSSQKYPYKHINI